MCQLLQHCSIAALQHDSLDICQDVDVLAQVMDTDDNGYIDYDEFCSFLYPQHWNAGAVQ